MAEAHRVKEGQARSGGCQCGRIRFEAQGKPIWVAHCHCADCRRATAAALATYAGFDKSQVRFTAVGPASYQSSPGVTRRFCPGCGTPISFESERWPEEIHLFVCTFDDPERFEPRAHVYTSEQLSWLHLGDDLPRYEKTSG